MPRSVSAAKRDRQNVKRRARNKANRSALKKQLKLLEKKAREDPAAAAQVFSQLQSAVDRAVRKHAIPKGRANRKKERWAAFLLRLKAQAAQAASPAQAPAAPAAQA
jgi:small subunit ribosomal protein S20